jgi:L-rhamnose isomerase
MKYPPLKQLNIQRPEYTSNKCLASEQAETMIRADLHWILQMARQKPETSIQPNKKYRPWKASGIKI